jgi:uncharacterized spore protein YtfJ
MVTEYTTAPDYESAMAEARKAGDGGPIDSFMERMVDRIGGKASVRAVFGDPIERDGFTIIPVARVRWAFGGGAGGAMGTGGAMGAGEPGFAADGAATPAGDATPGSPSFGSGAGGGATADPIGWLEIGPDGATFQSIVPAMPSPGFMLAVGATAALVLRALARLLRR